MNSTIKTRKYTLSFFVIILAVFSIYSTFAYAAGKINVDQSSDLEVSFQPENQPASDVSFEIYRIASVSEYGEYTFVEPYSHYPLSLDIQEESDWDKLVTTLSGYIAADQLQPAKTVVTDHDGIAKFSGIETGIYLVKGEQYRRDNKTYIPQTFIVALPNVNSENSWDYQIKSIVKYQTQTEPNQLTVLKVWDDQSNESRPKSIEIELYNKDVLFDTILLNSENNWTYTWTDLPEDGEWTVKEKEVPEGYEVNVEKQPQGFIVTNILKNSPNKPTPLPQTGQTWWPIPLLIIASVILFAVGCILKKHE